MLNVIAGGWLAAVGTARGAAPGANRSLGPTEGTRPAMIAEEA
jgi:hypothetical protein